MGVGSFFQKLAPWLSAGAQFVPGAGPVIAATINAIAKTHSVPLTAPADHTLPDTIENAVAALTGNSAAMQALKEADQTYALQMQAAGFKQVTDVIALGNQDRANARDMQNKTGSRMPSILGCLAVAALIMGFLLLAFHAPPEGTKSVVLLLIGAFSRDAASVYQYYFGSSQGSDAKTQIIGDIAKQP